MPAAARKAAISFGMVHIPVSLYTAVQEKVPSSIMRKFIYKSGRTQSAQGRETCP